MVLKPYWRLAQGFNQRLKRFNAMLAGNRHESAFQQIDLFHGQDQAGTILDQTGDKVEIYLIHGFVFSKNLTT